MTKKLFHQILDKAPMKPRSIVIEDFSCFEDMAKDRKHSRVAMYWHGTTDASTIKELSGAPDEPKNIIEFNKYSKWLKEYQAK